MEVADDPAAPNKACRAARSVLIPPNTLHHLLISQGVMAFLYLDPLSRDFAAVNRRMNEIAPCASFDLTDESAVIGALTSFKDGRSSFRECRSALEALLGIGTSAKQDHRILSALERMRMIHGGLIRWRNWQRAPGYQAPVSCTCSRLKRAFRCDATDCGIGWGPPSAPFAMGYP